MPILGLSTADRQNWPNGEEFVVQAVEPKYGKEKCSQREENEFITRNVM